MRRTHEELHYGESGGGETGARAAVSEGDVGKPCRPAVRLSQQSDHSRQKLLAGEAEALTRKAVEAAFAGDAIAMRLCLERILPRDRAVEFALPPIRSAGDIAQAMGAVTAALAGGLLTPGEAQAIARVFTTFVQTIETSDFDRRLQRLEARQADDRSGQPNGWVRSGVST